MKIILKDKNKYVLRFDKHEEIIQELKNFCQQQKIKAGVFQGLGAAKEVELAHYDVDKKRYANKVIRQKLEISVLIGNVAQMDGQMIIHAHGIFSDQTMQAQAGHVNRLIVAATCEIFLETLKHKIERRRDQTTGLNLMK